MPEKSTGAAEGRITFSTWQQRLEEKERECAWPGPRPLRTSDDAALLVGRDEDRKNFVREVRDRRLVFLTGPTGVGKTSLLEVGLAGELRAARYAVGICRNWAGSADAENPVDFLATKVFKAFEAKLPSDVSGWDVFWALDDAYPNRCVIVLDQFEELLRDSPLLRDAVFEILAELNAETDLKIVVSFRSEYLQDLKQLESQVKPFTMSHVALKQVADEFAIDVITAANRMGETPAIDAAPRGVATDAAAGDQTCAGVIARLWEAANKSADANMKVTRGERIGLLHLQAILYVLSYIAGEGNTVGHEHLNALRAEGPGDETEYALFARALQQAVSLKLDHCRDAAAGIDRWFLDGTLGTLAQVVRHLSSAGYKLIRGISDLANSALEDQIADLTRGMERTRESTDSDQDGPCSEEDVEKLIATIVNLTLTSDDADEPIDLLQSSGSAIAKAVDNTLANDTGRSETLWSRRLHHGGDPRLADPAGVTSGPMLGMAPANVLIEELRRFAFAVAWLSASDLARLSTPGAGSANLALIHDGFGTALEKWSNRTRDTPASALAAITAPKGGEFIWNRGADRFSVLAGSQERPNIVLNQRWKGAWLEADLKWVTFVGCDLRGTGFGFCTFEGVTFVNCLLDGALITDSSIVGAPPEGVKKNENDKSDYSLREPEFVIRSSREFTSVLNRYRETSIDTDELYIPLPGLPAEPAEDVGETLLELPETTGGLSIFGGRMSALTMRNLNLGDSGGILFANVAGSGIDIVEQNGGEFRVASSAIRNLTISPPLGELSIVNGQDPQVGKALNLSIASSAVVQTWISAGIVGEVELRNCSIVQFWNDSPDVRVVADDSRYYDLVGVELENSKPFGNDDSAVDRANTGVGLASRFRRMTYRRDASKRDDLAVEGAAGE